VATTLVRTQVLLEKEQHRRLAEMAERQGKSVSAVLREAAAAYIVADEREAKRERAKQALADLAAFRAKQTPVPGVTAADLLAEVRAEREAQMDEWLHLERDECPRE